MSNPFISITSTGGYIGRFFWQNSGVHPDFPHWGHCAFFPVTIVGAWAGLAWPIRQIINWRFYEPEDHDD